MAAIQSEYGAQAVQQVTEKFARLDDFIESQFRDAALAGLAINGEGSDVLFGRKVLQDADASFSVKSSAVKIIARLGTHEDVESLMRVCRDSWGEVRTEAGLAALRLSADPFTVAKELARSTDAVLSNAAYEWLYKQDSADVASFLGELLDNGDTGGRQRAITFF